jgi:hypothetical protein
MCACGVVGVQCNRGGATMAVATTAVVTWNNKHSAMGHSSNAGHQILFLHECNTMMWC